MIQIGRVNIVSKNAHRRFTPKVAELTGISGRIESEWVAELTGIRRSTGPRLEWRLLKPLLGRFWLMDVRFIKAPFCHPGQQRQ